MGAPLKHDQHPRRLDRRRREGLHLRRHLLRLHGRLGRRRRPLAVKHHVSRPGRRGRRRGADFLGHLDHRQRHHQRRRRRRARLAVQARPRPASGESRLEQPASSWKPPMPVVTSPWPKGSLCGGGGASSPSSTAATSAQGQRRGGGSRRRLGSGLRRRRRQRRRRLPARRRLLLLGRAPPTPAAAAVAAATATTRARRPDAAHAKISVARWRHDQTSRQREQQQQQRPTPRGASAVRDLAAAADLGHRRRRGRTAFAAVDHDAGECQSQPGTPLSPHSATHSALAAHRSRIRRASAQLSPMALGAGEVHQARTGRSGAAARSRGGTGA